MTTPQELNPLRCEAYGLHDQDRSSLIAESLGGEIRRCHSPEHPEQQVAVKVCSLRKIRNLYPRAMENPIRELRVLQQLPPHPNVVPLLEHFWFQPSSEDSPQLAMVLPLYACDLYTWLEFIHELKVEKPTPNQRRFKPFLYARAKCIFRDIARGIEHMHAHGFAHLDISVENVFLDDKLNAVVGDLGQAVKKKKWLVKCGRPGKFRSMAPEIFLPNTKCLSTMAYDMWALGLLLFSLLTGKSMLDCAQESSAHFQYLKRYGLRKHVQDMKEAHRLPEEALEVMAGLLEVDVEKRWTSQRVLQSKFCQE